MIKLVNAEVYIDGRFQKKDICIDNRLITHIGDASPSPDNFDCDKYFILPGLIDVHTHLREPGFFYKETILSGTTAGARGGFCDICSMPNLLPCPDNDEHLRVQEQIIAKDAIINVHPYGCITIGQLGSRLVDFGSLKDRVVAFSDDGKGVQSESVMRQAMELAKSVGSMIVAHCEDNALLSGGYINDGEYAKAHNHKGINNRSEYEQIARDIKLAKETGVKYHVCHISTKESVDLIRQAKIDGVDISCETAPHYLTLDDSMLQEDGRFKMNPPIRSLRDREALIGGIIDGTVDMIATDHAPHSANEKSKGLADSNMGVVGLETSFAIIYSRLVKTGIIGLGRLVELMHDNPKKRFLIGNDINVGEVASVAVFDTENKFIINSDDFVSKGKSTPFDGWEVYGKCVMNICNGRVVWTEKGRN